MADSGRKKTRLGTLLLEQRLVTPRELRSLLDAQQKSRRPARLGSSAVRAGMVDEVEILRALSEQQGVPGIDLSQVVVSLSILNLFNVEIARHYAFLPFSMKDGNLFMAMADPDEERVIREIEYASGLTVFPYVALHTQLQEVIEEAYALREAGELYYVGSNAPEDYLASLGLTRSTGARSLGSREESMEILDIEDFIDEAAGEMSAQRRLEMNLAAGPNERATIALNEDSLVEIDLDSVNRKSHLPTPPKAYERPILEEARRTHNALDIRNLGDADTARRSARPRDDLATPVAGTSVSGTSVSGTSVSGTEATLFNPSGLLDDSDLPFLDESYGLGAEAGRTGPGRSDGAPMKRVLVVDDDAEIRRMLRKVLGSAGLDVEEAENGREGLRKVSQLAPDLVVLDARLPGIHGFDLCKRLKESEETSRIPIIMMSAAYRGWRFAEDLKENFGVTSYLEKPFKIGDAMAAVERALNQEKEEEDPQELLSQRAGGVLRRAVSAYKRGELDRAIEMLNEVVEEEPDIFRLRYHLGLLYGRRDETFLAIEQLEKAIELQPRNFAALKNIAVLYQRVSFRHKAIEMWERAHSVATDEETRRGIKEHLIQLL